ncbi:MULTISPECIES: hypothetical protein [Planktothricoides]|uniref:Uncharacterized protein n=2 Tax=Planktothricoides raciborskii TaxID=132608 RepID=A0AAU8JCL4_9CYAN|nr:MULTISPECIES: hypothetical protein [Planktothricoides]KOR36320.1 hypothetical protein AM228_13080 [Planktothricoides sp. SR001]MBD2542431.1 hypothetical protein [Planktothricoides raciborskii FACHB-1370]MBD2582100.1 hypothetical protein [Planktothricoides raciborskii FACHB-1261]
MSTVVLSSRETSPTVSTPQHRHGSGHGAEGDRLIHLMRSVYQADHQVKLLHLHVEADTLLHQLQAALKQRQN